MDVRWTREVRRYALVAPSDKLQKLLAYQCILRCSSSFPWPHPRTEFSTSIEHPSTHPKFYNPFRYAIPNTSHLREPIDIQPPPFHWPIDRALVAPPPTFTCACAVAAAGPAAPAEGASARGLKRISDRVASARA